MTAPRGRRHLSSEPAPAEEIVSCFNRIPQDIRMRENWGTGGPESKAWDVNAETYINGIVLIFDFDYYMGYLIEVVDRTASRVTYYAITEYHGRREDGSIESDWALYPHDCGIFFKRTEAGKPTAVSHWAVSTVHAMVEQYENRHRDD